MTSYEFEVIAKNAVIEKLRKDYSISLNIQDIDFVWFAHELGNKKCTLYSPKLALYPEVTYNASKDELYIDIYKKISHTTLSSDKFKREV